RGDCLVLPADPGPAPAREHVVNLLAQLYVRGVDIDWKKFADPGAIASFVEPPQEAMAARPERIEVNIFQANQELLDRYFRQQTDLVQLAIQQTGPSECRMLLQTALESNERILNAVLAVNEQAVRGLLGNSATSPPAPSRTIAAPAPIDKRDTADEPAGDLASRVQQCLRAETTRVTGFPPEAITPDLSFTDLGIDSLSMAEIWGEVLDKMPELEEYADHIFEIHSLADIRKIWAPDNAAEAKASSKALAPSAPPQRPRWRELRPVLVDAISARLGIEALRILDSQDFDTELRLDVFTREELYRESLAHHPGYRLAGRELLNARNLFELGALLERFELPESAEAGQEAVTRFIRRREKVVLAASARLPARVLIAGEASPGMTQLHQLLQNAGICVVSLQAGVGGWSSSSERFPLDSVSDLRTFVDRTFGPRPFTVVFVAEGQAACAEALETGVTSLFVLAKALWGEEDRKPLNHFAVVGTAASMPVYHAARGLARSLRREFSDVPINCVWLQSNLQDVERSGLLDALFSDRLEHDVFEERGQFYREVADPNSLAAVDNLPAPRLSHTSRVLILGGGDGISAEIGVGLAQTYGCEIVAIGRTPWPAELPYAEIEPGPEAERLIKRKLYEEIEAAGRTTGDLLQQRWKLVSRQRALWFTRSRIEAAGGRFQYYSADARDAAALRRTLEEILAQEPVHGVIHGAGVIRDGLLAQKTIDEFRDVVKTKAISAVILREALETQPLAFVFFLSSMTSFTGTAGQTDYA
ncbi:MAG: KR domain-containing protein, partial [Bryobacteraceae bacterium]|nr:KR domain-containing protein [Bryobacteraceae bacterium]